MFEPGLEIRIPLYIAFGIISEVLFTAIYDLVKPGFLKSWNVFGNAPLDTRPQWRDHRDVRAMGYTFLWMLPIYALIFLMEPLIPLVSGLPFFIRGALYALGIWAIEYIGGFFIKKISGKIPWDYSLASTQVHGLIRLDFFPYWFLFGLGAEWLVGKLLLLTPAMKAL